MRFFFISGLGAFSLCLNFYIMKYFGDGSYKELLAVLDTYGFQLAD
jgi:hypothetical protein